MHLFFFFFGRGGMEGKKTNISQAQTVHTSRYIHGVAVSETESEET